jgi:DNA end-binding protein Ku
VEWEHIVKGYEFAKGRYVTMEDEDFDKVRLETSDAIRLVEFVDAAELPALFVERAHYLVPDGRVAAEAYAVMREAMKGKVGIGKLVMSGRERIVAIQPHDTALVLYSLYYADEVRPAGELAEIESIPSKVDERELKLAQQLVESVSGELDLAQFRDEYRTALTQVIEQKVAGEEVTPTYTAETPQVIDLMSALKASLDKAGKAKKKPARAELKPARAPRRAAAGAASPAKEAPPRKRARAR